MNNYYDYLAQNNGMIMDMNYQSGKKTSNNFYPTNNLNLANLNQGFIRGNMFQNQYEGYKNYKPIEPTINSEREDLLEQIQMLNFAMIDLDLFLDTNPSNLEALRNFNAYKSKEKELCATYESKFGPLTLNSSNNLTSWTWINSPWPWEVQA